MYNTYKDLSPDRCLASVITCSALTVVFILEMRVGKYLKIETAEAICRSKQKRIVQFKTKTTFLLSHVGK